jgi:ferredoxin
MRPSSTPGAAPAPDDPSRLTLVVETARGGRTIQGAAGEPLLGALRAAAVPIRSVCGGKASCGTCRVTVAAAWLARLPPAQRTERRLLACLEGAGPDDRLACQVTLAADHDGLAVRVCAPAPALGPA